MSIAAAAALADAVTALDGVAVRAVLLHGSLATGAFRPTRSDLDLLVVVDDGLTDEQASALERLAHRADLGDAAGLDLDVVTARVAAAPVREPALELHIGRYPGPPDQPTTVEVERRVAAAPDLLAELSMARADGRSLRGAAPHEVIGPVPPAWVVDRGRHWLRTWQTLTDDTEHAAFMVLTACRIWRFAVEGRHCAKTEAAAWALQQDPSLTAIRQALSQYEGEPSVPVPASAIATVLDRALTQT
ncbi:aminoglycoside adenylyltransferase domain-containing protein, partial [Actinoplanes awajinensis]